LLNLVLFFSQFCPLTLDWLKIKGCGFF
jgi:hypothetical protein